MWNIDNLFYPHICRKCNVGVKSNLINYIVRWKVLDIVVMFPTFLHNLHLIRSKTFPSWNFWKPEHRSGIGILTQGCFVILFAVYFAGRAAKLWSSSKRSGQGPAARKEGSRNASGCVWLYVWWGEMQGHVSPLTANYRPRLLIMGCEVTIRDLFPLTHRPLPFVFANFISFSGSNYRQRK